MSGCGNRSTSHFGRRGIIRSAMRYLGRWDCHSTDVFQGTFVIMQKPTPTTKGCTLAHLAAEAGAVIVVTTNLPRNGNRNERL